MPSPTKDYLPPVVVFGCRSLVPCHGHPPDAAGNLPPFHAPADPEKIGGSPWPHAGCPGCGGRSGGRVHCAWCRSSPEPERRDRALRAAVDAKDRKAAERQKAQRETDKLAGDPARPLTEKERRYVERKYGTEGRAWLRALGQLPDHDLILDRRGNVIGRLSESDPEAEESAA